MDDSSHRGEIDNPVPQLPPGASSHAVRNPVLLDVTADTNQWKTPSDKLVIVLCGLPARGKTFMGQKIYRCALPFLFSPETPEIKKGTSSSSTRST